MVQHVNIADADRHENKGASTALSGQVLKADGDGTTSFVNPSTLQNVTVISTLESQSTTSQNPTGTDTALQVVWGAGAGNSDASIASNGVVTISTAGLYFVTFNLSFGRSNNTGTSIMGARLLVNDVVVGFTQAVHIDTSVNIVPFHASILRSFNATDTIKVEIIRDSSGTDDGGLIATDVTASGWNSAPSAAIRIQRIGGGF